MLAEFTTDTIAPQRAKAQISICSFSNSAAARPTLPPSSHVDVRHPLHRSHVLRTLESSGYQVVEAATGDEALRICKDRGTKIDLLLSDVVLPGGINGCELADQLLAQMSSLKVLLVSGYSPGAIGSGPNPQERHNSFFLQKPFPPQALIHTVRRCLDTKKTPAATTTF